MRESKKLFINISFFLVLTFIPAGNLSALYFSGDGLGFPENTEVRQRYYKQMTGTNKEALSLLPDFVVIESTGVRVNFFTVKEGGNLYFCFSHGQDLNYEKGEKGSYIIKRSLDYTDDENMGITQIKIFIKNDDNSFLRLRKGANNDSILDIELFGRLIQSDIRVPLSLSELTVSSFERLAELTSSYVDWNFYISDYRKLYGQDVRVLSETIKPLLGFLQDSDDGSIDKDGSFVYIDSLKQQNGDGGLNCSGFAKWVIDGIYKPVTGTNIDIAYLKEKHYELRGNKWSARLEGLDPYFGLDWTRNLAYEILKLTEPEAPITAVDVKNLRYHEYRENIGYPVSDLKTVLYELAVKYPQNFYLGSLNSKSEDPPYLRVHTHVVVIFPYIDMKGDFQIDIYSRNKKIDLEFLKANWKDNFIHLVKVEAATRFEPSGIDFNPVLRR
ncbi:MAG: hypothetical protein L3J12_03995 [Spirochaetales bacterium]|nr:hypothetical protein [Spirochaetales bacterium]